MIDTAPAPLKSSMERLAPVRCALCGNPVSHFTTVANAKAGGMCQRDSCVKNPKTGKKREVYTFNVVVDSL